MRRDELCVAMKWRPKKVISAFETTCEYSVFEIISHIYSPYSFMERFHWDVTKR